MIMSTSASKNWRRSQSVLDWPPYLFAIKMDKLTYLDRFDNHYSFIQSRTLQNEEGAQQWKVRERFH